MGDFYTWPNSLEQYEETGFPDSDFEAEPLKRPRLDEYMTMGEVAGQIPESLLLNVSFEKFTKENGFEAIDQEF